MDRKDEEKFEYSYSAPTAEERREIEGIRRQYCPAQDTESAEHGLETLRRLDKKVKSPATAVALTLGIAGVLIFGLGLTAVLEWNALGIGIAVSFIGAAIASLSHPVYTAILKRRKRKYAARILELSETLLEEKREGDTSARN